MTDLTPAASIFSQSFSSINFSFLIIISPVTGFLIFSAMTLPKTLSDKLTKIFPPSIISEIVTDDLVLQSHSFLVICTSWATSHNLLVKYPELAVFKAVSAKPFLAPWVELKYSKTDNPSLKFAIIGVSIISPDGFAINPLIPASCFIWACDPLAPESAIM